MTLWRDLTYAARRLSKSPAFTAAAVISIALGISANATIFSVVSRFVLRPAPVGDPATLMELHTTQHAECCNHFTWPLFTDLRTQTQSFSGLAAYYDLVPASVGGAGEPERVWGQATTSNFFDVTQLQMTLGRGFLPGEERLPVVVIGHNLWRRSFGADPNIIGKPVMLSGRPFTVAGVAPPAFHSLDQILYTQFWIPLALTDQLLPRTSNFESREYNWLSVTGRLKPGVSQAQAAAELKVLAQRVATAYPRAEKDRGFVFESAGSLPPRDRPFLLMFIAALTVVVLLVLCIAGANVTNLLLSQASAREREMSVRRALGATRGQLTRQILTESVVLALSGGLLGIALSQWATTALSALRLPAPVPLDLAVHVDWRTLLYTFALSLAMGLLFGLAPAAAASRPIPFSRPGSRFTLRNILVVAQISLSLVLLCATGLFLRSLQNAASIDTGFRSQGVLMMSVDPRLNGYTPERTARFLTQLQRTVAALPGVASAACTDVVPLSMGHRSDSFHSTRRPSAATRLSVDMYMASPGYFETLGIPRVAGRDFATENPTGPKVAVVNELFAQEVFPNENPIGQTVTGAGVTYQIVGIVRNIKSRTIGEDLRPVLFRSLDQIIAADPSVMGYSLVVRAAAGTAPAIRRQIAALDPTLAVFNVGTMEEHFRDALFLPRLAGTLFGIFGAIGLALAAVGLYGVMSYSVSRRTREIGIRMALGSQAGSVQRLIIRQGMLLTAVAVVLGLAGAWAAAKLSASILYGIHPHDAATFTLVPLFLAAVALVACWIPARRAERIDPLTALRHE